ncbi:MAG: FAD-binding and (Fe-S)-binding domain-containing protein [Salinivirgaceae bacterium]|jgi:FAD/FMN-containing dehydrogenase/Fe-S oxidoreductase|nr:FAD-binding protein [Bacteroidales bacterium]
MSEILSKLGPLIDGELKLDSTTRLLYSTDASVYREIPAGVVFPKNANDIQKIVEFCHNHKFPIIARGAGTSLAGQVVGKGLIMDTSRYLTKILELNIEEKWVRVEPGVILDELNRYLKPYGLFFGPETSTSSRCTIGGMVGNNSCGSRSIVYKTTREHLLEAKVILSDGSSAVFKSIDKEEFEEKRGKNNLEGRIYQQLDEILQSEHNRNTIIAEYPDSSIYRRNNGYAIDLLAKSNLYFDGGDSFNLCKILSGSEGTLAIGTEFKLNLVDLPYSNVGLLCVHFDSLEEALQGNLIALQFSPSAVELMDYKILDAAKKNINQERNRFFIKGNPKAILIIELVRADNDKLQKDLSQLIEQFKSISMGYHYPIVTGNDVSRVWSLRKAGLGVLSNIEGDAKPVTVMEDTAVKVELLPEYIVEFQKLLDKHQADCVFYAHVGSGELHLRPVLNLKSKSDRVRFRKIATDIAHLVKKHRGSLSGEHGDGRLRSEFIKIMIGDVCYSFLEKIKGAFDPNNILNPGKIVYPVAMDECLRYAENQQTREIESYFDFSEQGGMLRAVEKCNGSADCRRVNTFSGNMCPTYMATLDEAASTRARANLLREFLTHSTKKNPFAHRELFEILDLCISCKACKTECPSNIDMAKFKSEFLQHYHDEYGISLRTRCFANIALLNKIMSFAPALSNFFTQNRLFSNPIKRIIGVAGKRNLPKVNSKTLRKSIKSMQAESKASKGTVYLFVDEFTNHTDVDTGIAAILLLLKLGYNVLTVKHPQSGRAYISKGYLRKATKIAKQQIDIFSTIVSGDIPLVGIEPSAILSFRDEYPQLLKGEMQRKAKAISENCLLIDEFIVREYKKGNIEQNLFTDEYKDLKLHTHCQQKAIAGSNATIEMLQIPKNYKVEIIRSGCCGMAGSFGYEKEHYNLSMKIGELDLFPAILQSDKTTIIAANGTSCRQQIYDGTGREALHPVEILYKAISNVQ